MQSNVLTEVFLPIALAIIMLGMGLSLVVDDFKRILLYPKAIMVGILNQIIILPLAAFGIIAVLGVQAELAVGLVILSACPGGVTSNMISLLAKGDTALSISLTVVSSIFTIFTIPFLVNYAIIQFIPGGEQQALPVLKTVVSVLIITLLPVAIGMAIRRRNPNFAQKLDRPVKILSVIIILMMIGAIFFKERERLGDFFRQVGLATLLLNLVTIGLGFWTSRLTYHSPKQSLTIAIESGIQNVGLSIAIATTLLHNPAMAIPGAVYALLMNATAFGLIWWGNRVISD